MNRLNLAVGPATLALDFEEKSLREYFRDYFMDNISLAEPDLVIDIRLSDETPMSGVPNSLFLTKIRTGRGFEAGDGLIRGKYDQAGKKWLFTVNLLLVKNDYKRVFEQILYQAFYSVVRKRNFHLIHSSSVIREGSGYLFFGPSESGKSTVARLSSPYQILNDEINLIDLEGEIPMLIGTPFNGLFRDKEPGSAPLKGLFLLNQAPEHRIEPLRGGKAVKALAGEIIPPIGLEGVLNPMTYPEMMDRAKVLCDKIPLYRMDFLPDDGFWEILSQL